MFPWLAFGHMIPYLELSKGLAAKGIMVSYISTPTNLQRLPPVPPLLAPKMQLLPLPMQPVDGLPEDCEVTIEGSDAVPEESARHASRAVRAPASVALAGSDRRRLHHVLIGSLKLSRNTE